ncbi:MAG: MarR family winged helix-turn-helix transcriptional regulator [Acidimicrobiales bacterium]
MATTSTPATPTSAGTTEALDITPGHPGAGPAGSVPAALERAMTQVGRAILRLGVPQDGLAEGVSIDKAGYWLLVRVSEYGPIRLSDLAESVELDLSTVSRQMRDLVHGGLITKVPDPRDGRSSFLSLSAQGAAVLESVSEARREALADALAGWSDEERATLTAGLLRLAAGLHPASKDNR